MESETSYYQAYEGQPQLATRREKQRPLKRSGLVSYEDISIVFNPSGSSDTPISLSPLSQRRKLKTSLEDISVSLTGSETREWTQAKEKAKYLIDQLNLCQGVVGSYYALEVALKNADVIMFYHDPSQQEKGAVLIGNFKTKPFFRVDVICSLVRGVGMMMMRLSEDLARKRNLWGVILDSAEESYGFYRRLGYKSTSKCADREDVMIDRMYMTMALPLIEARRKEEEPTEKQWRNYDSFFNYLKAIASKREGNTYLYPMLKCFGWRR